MSGLIGSRNSKSGIIGPVGFFARNDNGSTYTSSSDISYPHLNYGSEYFDGTVFTAPVFGFYAISWSVKGTSSNVNVYCRAKKNGTSFGPALEFKSNITSEHTCMSFNFKLEPGDQIKIGHASNVKVDGSDHFAICLIG